MAAGASRMPGKAAVRQVADLCFTSPGLEITSPGLENPNPGLVVANLLNDAFNIIISIVSTNDNAITNVVVLSKKVYFVHTTQSQLYHNWQDEKQRLSLCDVFYNQNYAEPKLYCLELVCIPKAQQKVFHCIG